MRVSERESESESERDTEVKGEEGRGNSKGERGERDFKRRR